MPRRSECTPARAVSMSNNVVSNPSPTTQATKKDAAPERDGQFFLKIDITGWRGEPDLLLELETTSVNVHRNPNEPSKYVFAREDWDFVLGRCILLSNIGVPFTLRLAGASIAVPGDPLANVELCKGCGRKRQERPKYNPSNV